MSHVSGMVCQPTVVGMPANGGWRACQRWFPVNHKNSHMRILLNSHIRIKKFGFEIRFCELIVRFANFLIRARNMVIRIY